jgi:hypothetical protein
MGTQALLSRDPANDYLQTYREWRYAYGLNDPCIDELRAAILVESERDALPITVRDRLETLACLIKREQGSSMERTP